MIEFNETNKIFYLSGKSFSYLIWIDPNGYLVNLHYGGRIESDDLTYFDMRTRPISFSRTAASMACSETRNGESC